MASGRVLVDTSLFIEHLRSREKSATTLYRLQETAEPETGAIVAAELFYGARRQGSEEQVAAVLEPFFIHDFTSAMAARLPGIVQAMLRDNRTADLRDLMIAATALETGLPVATLNKKHFECISGIEIAD